MLQQRWSFVAVAIVTCILQAQGADKYTDENRPYEFGFNIDGEQHRHEKKDENGLIMGEFGFITADGVYHVTVYATDENGNFKILSMKNIRVKPYPTAPERMGHSLPFPPSRNPSKTEGPSPQKPPIAVSGPPQASPARSCSSCSIPTTTTRKPQLTDLAVVSKDRPSSQFGNNGAVNPQGGSQIYPGGQKVYPSPNDAPSFGQNQPSAPGVSNPQPSTGSQSSYPQQGQNYPQQGSSGPQQYPQGSSEIQTSGQTAQGPLGNTANERNPKQLTNYPQRPTGQGPQGSFGQNPQGPFGQSPQGSAGQGPQGPFGQSPQGVADQYGPQSNDRPSKPTLITAQMQIVDKNTDIYKKNPGEKDGLPDGITKDDMLRLLYTFNYTVGFHGHHEEGYTNGAKQGYYYVTGRNGVRTRVDYVADEKGFRPKISQEVLDLLSEDVPKPETEKDEKYGLKGYEFKWLYYPVESSNRR